jgi:DNA-binding GntR family transcriptional regulator
MTRKPLSIRPLDDLPVRRPPVRQEILPRPETLSEAAYERVAANLMDGAYVPGDRVATRGLATDLGVSATPAREAMLRLVSEGALELRNARTIVVPTLTAARLKEIYCIRYAFEPMAAQEAAPNISDDDVKKLERTQERMRAAYDRQDYPAVFHENREFHFRIYGAAGMPLVSTFIKAAWLRIGPTFRLLYPTLAVPADAIRVHELAIAAARAHDATKLAAAIHEDLARGERLLSRVIQS